MEAEISELIKKYGLDKAISIVAVSGGVDSVVLLDLLSKSLPASNLIVAHVNHGLRKASAREAIFVGRLAEGYGLRYLQKRLSLGSADENTARVQRYKWLRSEATLHNAQYIITAHHLDDQLETIIINLARGVGPLEIWGMKERQGDILRPLLNISKREIREYAARERLDFVEDESNCDLRYTRNSVRHRVIPELRRINPGLEEVVRREILLGGEASDYLEQIIKKSERRVVNSNSIELDPFEKLHPYVQKEIVRRMLQRHTGRETDIYQKNIDAVMNLVAKKGTKKTQLGSLVVEKGYHKLVFDPKLAKAPRPEKLTLGSETVFGRHTFFLGRAIGRQSKSRLLLPEDFSDNLRVRTWRSGDKVQASFGRKKVQDVFTDAKVDRSERRIWPIVTHNDEVIWVPGLISAKIKGKKKLMIEVK